LKTNEKRKATFAIAMVPIIFLIVNLLFVLKSGLEEAHIALFMSAIFAAGIAIFVLKYKWAEIEEGIVSIIKMSMGAIIILMIIGMVIATWIASGIVPAMIYYGLKILSPEIFLIATLLICSVVSLATGSSWTTAATVGIALMGVGVGLGFSAPMVGGAVISGAYFGDKMSPLSDTTNLAPAVAGAKLFDHIKHMLYTTGPAYVVAMIFFTVLGFVVDKGDLNAANIDAMLAVLDNTFVITPWLLLVPVIVITAVILKVPAIPGLFGGAVLGGIAMLVVQDGNTLAGFFDAMNNGVGFGIKEMMTDSEVVYDFTANFSNMFSQYGNMTADFIREVNGVETTITLSGVDAVRETIIDAGGRVDELVSGGGMQDMMWTVSLILSAMVFGGVMEVTGMLRALANGILSIAKGRGGLVLSTVTTAIAMNIIAGDQYLAIVIPGRMYKESFDELGLHPKNLSRALEDSATLTSPLIPWNTCGASMMSFLNLNPWTYVPYCILNLVTPIISVIYGYTGFSMHKKEEHQEKVA